MTACIRMLRGYGATFFIIQIYTLFFTQLAEHLGWLASLIIGGVSALRLEAKRRETNTKNVLAEWLDHLSHGSNRGAHAWLH